MMRDQLLENIETNENNTIDNSVYSNSLNRLLKLCNNYINTLNSDNVSIQQKYLNIKIEQIAFTICSAIPLFIGAIASPIIASTATLLIDLFNIIITSHIKKKYNNQIGLINNLLNTLDSIEQYLKSELEISKNCDNLLSNSQVLEIEKKFKRNIQIMGNDATVLSNINYQYCEEYQKNLIIIDTLKTLDDNQKKEYLNTVYNNIKDVFVKTNINISDNEVLTSIDSNSQKMLTTNNSLNVTSQNQDEISNSTQKKVSLNKDDYTINKPNELNNIFTIYQQDEDILPPKAQEELEKRQQLSKKIKK